MTTGAIEREGFKLRYHIEGEGIPVVVCNSVAYHTFSEQLPKHCKLICLDTRVFGGSALKETERADFEPDLIYADIEALRQHLNLDQMVMVGHSGQSYFALEYAKRYPEYVSHVVMIGMSPTFDDKSHQWAEENWQSIASNERKEAFKNNIEAWPDAEIGKLPVKHKFIKDYIRKTPKIWFDYNYDAGVLWKDVDFSVQGISYIWGELFPKLDITKGLENFDIPVAVMLGKYDGLIAPSGAWDMIRDKFKCLEIHVFEESGHTPQLEEPKLFDKYLLEFIHKNKVS